MRASSKQLRPYSYKVVNTAQLRAPVPFLKGNMSKLFVLLILYQIKHFIADYPLQGKYMLGKFKPGWDFLGPLAAHCTVHGLFTYLIAMFAGYDNALNLSIIDFSAHFIMDRIKASPKYLGRFKPLTAETYVKADKKALRSNVLFWWSLGLDQMVHHLTHYYLIAKMVGFL